MIRTILTLLIFNLLFVGCTGLPRDPTVTFSEEGCTFDLPERVNEEFVIYWTVEESASGTVILEVVIADPAMSLEEIASLPAIDPPPEGITKLSWAVAMSPGVYSKEVDLRFNAAYHGEPVYIVCLSPYEEAALGAGGPLEVKR
jgi:hypothetical protein